MSTVLTWLIGFLKIVIVLGTLITIHELGHFTIAKLCKVKVNKFAIGFGPKLFTKNYKDTEYTLRLFPFGGFVQMEGEEERSEDKNAFNNKPVWQRIAICAAGATVNIVFALVVYFFICSSTNMYSTNVVAELEEDGPLYISGIREGDKILKVDGKNVINLREIEDAILASKDDELNFLIERDNIKQEIPVIIENQSRGYFGVAFTSKGEAQYIYKGSPADKAGIEVGDLVTSINGVAVNDPEEIVTAIRSLVDKDIELEVQRNGETIKLSGTTSEITGRFFDLVCDVIEPGFIKGIPYALNETGYYLTATIAGTVQVFTGKAENVEVMGPVGIASEITSTRAWADFFYLMSAISLSLGIFNLLPVPALDGGRIVILIVEGIRRKPLKETVEQGLILAGFAAIILLAICVTVSDVIKFF